MKKILFSRISTLTSIAIIAFLCFSYVRLHQAHKKLSTHSENLHMSTSAVSDSIYYYKRKYGNQVAQTAVAVVDLKNLKNVIGKQNKLIGELSSRLTKHSTAGTIIKTKTIIKEATATQMLPVPPIISIKDTIFDCPPCNEGARYGALDNNWINLQSWAGLDSTRYEIDIEDKLIIDQKTIKDGWFKRKSIVEVENFNPYVQITEMEGWQKPIPPQKWGLSIFAGYGLNQSLEPSAIFGIGLSYSLIQFE